MNKIEDDIRIETVENGFIVHAEARVGHRGEQHVFNNSEELASFIKAWGEKKDFNKREAEDIACRDLLLKKFQRFDGGRGVGKTQSMHNQFMHVDPAAKGGSEMVIGYVIDGEFHITLPDDQKIRNIEIKNDFKLDGEAECKEQKEKSVYTEDSVGTLSMNQITGRAEK